MRYWDASALAPIVVAEETSELVQSWLDEDDAITTWAWTRVELASAIERRVRVGEITREERQVALTQAASLAARWNEVFDLTAVRKRALALLARHPLRAADAAQLAAALLVADEDPTSLPFVCLDRRLALAAEGEGFAVLVGNTGNEADEQ